MLRCATLFLSLWSLRFARSASFPLAGCAACCCSTIPACVRRPGSRSSDCHWEPVQKTKSEAWKSITRSAKLRWCFDTRCVQHSNVAAATMPFAAKHFAS